jgi:hypothetical protein
MALAPTIEDKVEAAYRRGDHFDKRRALMDAWSGFCGQKFGLACFGDGVTAIRPSVSTDDTAKNTEFLQ